MAGEWVTLAQIIGARGNRGEVLAQLFSSQPARFQELRQVSLLPAQGERQAAELEEAWEYRGAIVLKFAGVDSIDEAEKLAGMDLQVPLAERAPAPEGEFFQSDLIGCRLVEKESGHEVGTVAGWEEFGGTPLLSVTLPDQSELLVPFAKAICVEIRPDEKKIVVELPEGLLDLNRQ